MLSEQLVNLIERNADSLAKSWLADVQKHPDTPTFHNFDPVSLYERSFMVYSQLSKWISNKTARSEIAEYYMDLARKRKKEGFALSEIIQSLIIIRRHLWLKVLNEGLLDTALELHKALELDGRVIHFFDQATFYTALGYEKA